MDFSSWCTANNYDLARCNAQQRRHLEAAYRADTGNGEDVPFAEVADEPAELFRAELQRYLDQQVDDAGRQRIQAAADRAIRDGATLQQFKIGLMQADRTLGGIRTHWAQQDVGTESEILAASIAMSAGCSERFCGSQFGERVMNQAVSARYRNASFHSLLRMQIQRGWPAADGQQVD